MSLSTIIKSWLIGHWFIRRIVKSAMDQYYKRKQLDPVFSETEIVLQIFRLWYLNPKKKYSENQKDKIQRYLDAEFYPHNLLELCLISLDIEYNINPTSDQNFDSIANATKEIMVNYDYAKEKSSQIDPYKPESISTENAGIRIVDYTGRWYENFL